MEAKRSLSLIGQVPSRQRASTSSLRHRKAVAVVAIDGFASHYAPPGSIDVDIHT
jgi:hypothetical protein